MCKTCFFNSREIHVHSFVAFKAYFFTIVEKLLFAGGLTGADLGFFKRKSNAEVWSSGGWVPKHAPRIILKRACPPPPKNFKVDNSSEMLFSLEVTFCRIPKVMKYGKTWIFIISNTYLFPHIYFQNEINRKSHFTNQIIAGCELSRLVSEAIINIYYPAWSNFCYFEVLYTLLNRKIKFKNL